MNVPIRVESMTRSMDYLEFLCLNFAVVNSEYSCVILKPKHVLCLEAAHCGRDLAVLPTGYGSQ